MFQIETLQLTYPALLLIALESLMLISAVGLSILFWRYFAVLREAGAVGGIWMILAGFWIVTLFYMCDLFFVLALPAKIGVEAAKNELFRLHFSYTWHVSLTVVVLMTLGILFAIRATISQNRKVIEAAQEVSRNNRHKSSFFASMSHELRTPLNAILGFAELLQRNHEDDPKGRTYDYATSILRSGRLLHSLVDDLLDLSRIEAGRLELSFGPTSIADVVGSARDMLSADIAKAELNLHVEASAFTPVIVVDHRAIHQVLLNLISNAIKFTPPNGNIWVIVSPRDGGGVDLTVKDNGVGINSDRLDNIFEPFVHSDPLYGSAEKGHGLGLKICKELVEMHGGTITVQSSVVAGTSVDIYLPPAPPGYRSAEEGQVQRRLEPSGGSANIAA